MTQVEKRINSYEQKMKEYAEMYPADFKELVALFTEQDDYFYYVVLDGFAEFCGLESCEDFSEPEMNEVERLLYKYANEQKTI